MYMVIRVPSVGCWIQMMNISTHLGGLRSHEMIAVIRGILYTQLVKLLSARNRWRPSRGTWVAKLGDIAGQDMKNIEELYGLRDCHLFFSRNRGLLDLSSAGAAGLSDVSMELGSPAKHRVANLWVPGVPGVAAPFSLEAQRLLSPSSSCCDLSWGYGILITLWLSNIAMENPGNPRTEWRFE